MAAGPNAGLAFFIRMKLVPQTRQVNRKSKWDMKPRRASNTHAGSSSSKSRILTARTRSHLHLPVPLAAGVNRVNDRLHDLAFGAAGARLGARLDRAHKRPELIIERIG